MDAGFDAGPLDAGPADAGLDAGPPAPRFEDCDSSRVCAPDFRCEGFVESIGLGKCVPTVAPPGEGTECSVLDGCGDGLLCAGYTRGFGLCLPEWMRESFYDSEGAPIPDNASAGLTRTLTVYGLATVDMDVEMDLVFEHPAPSELRITLTNPDGNEVVVYNGATAGDPAGRVVIRAPLFGFSGDESVNGEWTLNVVDDVAGNTGTLERWTLTVASRYD